VVNPAGVDGWLHGNFDLFFTQLKGMVLVVAYSFTVGWIIFKLIDFINPIRVSEDEEEAGLDETQHGEKYVQGTLIVKTDSSNAAAVAPSTPKSTASSLVEP
jgi:Amt family ammonium transporter